MPPTLDEWLSSTLPSGTAWHCSGDPVSAGALLPAENKLTAKMAPSRLRSFRHGRHCARTALLKLGLPATAVPTDTHRAPVWPDGIVGSISHSEDLACAVAARTECLGGIGIDLERPGKLDREVTMLICTASERAMLKSLAIIDGPRLLFSIKESIYKCLWPQVRRFIEFHEVEVELYPENRAFRARSVDLDKIQELAELTGYYWYSEALLCAVCYLPPAESGRG